MNRNLEQLARPPAAWYLFGAARQLRKKPVAFEMFGRRFVAFRTASGACSILDARCPHMGADLSGGCIVGERLQCPYHHWEFGPHGRCEHIPVEPAIPPFARVTSYPIAEQHGLLYFFNGPEPLYPLPRFAATEPDRLSAAPALVYDMSIPWYLYCANAFDLQHMRIQHGRELIGEPEIDEPEPFAMRIRLRAKIVGPHLADRVLRWVAGDPVEIAITVHAGTLVHVTAQFRRARSWVHFGIQPIDDRISRLQIMAMRPAAQSGPARLLEPANLLMRRWFTRIFFGQEMQQLDGIEYRPATLLPADRAMAEFLDWAADLPRSSAPRSERLSLPLVPNRKGETG